MTRQWRQVVVAILGTAMAIGTSQGAIAATHAPRPEAAASVPESTCGRLQQTGAVVLARALNLHGRPSSSAPIRGIVYEGAQLRVTRLRAGWAHVAAANGEAGWVRTEFLDATSVGEAPQVSVNAVNLRSAPSLTGQVKRVLAEGTRVLVFESYADAAWLDVTTSDGTNGWIAACFLG
jgi:N-acetylmuramoyl-L-alanine amidase